jgi:putative molybdenum carrier protein
MAGGSMPLAVYKIVSGGQAGADIGALAAARELGIQTGGFAPKGWLTENGPQESLLRGFGLIECEEDGYPARTRSNVEHSDGTLLVGDHRHGGSRLTYELAKQFDKPLFLLAYLNLVPVDEFRDWRERHEIRVLNVAGNRESQSPGIEEFTHTFLLKAFSRQ